VSRGWRPLSKPHRSCKRVESRRYVRLYSRVGCNLVKLMFNISIEGRCNQRLPQSSNTEQRSANNKRIHSERECLKPNQNWSGRIGVPKAAQKGHGNMKRLQSNRPEQKQLLAIESIAQNQSPSTVTEMEHRINCILLGCDVFVAQLQCIVTQV